MSQQKTGYPSIDKPWLKYYSEEAINAPLPECTAFEYLFEYNKENQDDVAIICFNKKVSFKELFINIEKAAAAFYAMGVRENDIVAICSVTLPEVIYTKMRE